MRQLLFRTRTAADAAAALARARQALERLRAGGDFTAVRGELADGEVAPLPDVPLPSAKLMDYLGPTAARIALSLAVGEVSDPVRSSAGYHVLQVVDRQPDEAPPLAKIEPQVVSEFRRQAGEQALRAYLDDLRARARVEVSPQLP